MSARGEARLAGSDVDVCIVSYNSATVLAGAIASVVTHLPGATISIREHGADVASLEHLHEIASTCPLTGGVDVDSTNPGFGAGCNALAKASTATWLLFLNPDAEIVRWPWSGSSPPPVAEVVGPAMQGPGEAARHSGRSYRVRDEIARSWLRRAGERPDGRGFVSGAAILVDRHSFDVVGGFDPGYFMYYEDIDFCLRANDAGIPTRLAEDWHVRHDGAHSTGAHFAESLIWSYESACRFHGGRGAGLVGYRIYVTLDSVARTVLAALRRDSTKRRAYVALTRRAVTDIPRRGTGAASARR